MDDDLFEELMQSIREAGAILRGEAEPARTTRYDDEGNAVLAEPDARRIRVQLGLTRTEFASLLGVSARTLEGWEQGRRRPTGPALTLLRVTARYPENVLETMKASPNTLN